MSTIRRQSIISSGIVYFGFALGFLNTYLFAREGGFTKEEYGLTGLFIAIANVMYSVANLGMQAYIYKFYPYYHDNLPPKKNDMMTWALATSIIGFIFVMIGGWIFRDMVIKNYGTNSPKLVVYYAWIFPFGFGLTIYSLLEAFGWQLKKSILTNFLKEVQFRLFTTILIVLTFFGAINSFDLFIKIYAVTYLLLAAILGGYLLYTKQLHFTFSVSRVTKKFFKKIVTLMSLIWSGNLVFTVSNVFDSLVIAAVMENGLAYTAIYTLAQNIASLIQAPQRGIISSSIAALSRAWKDKDMEKIKRIYHRSSVNQIIFSAGMFVLIWINFTDGIYTFHLQKDYVAAKEVFLFIGLMRIIDMGTGVNSQIIGTSTFWRFDFVTGIILLSLTLPLNYFLTRTLGVTGPAIANLFALTLYNFIRYSFLAKRFNMQPFTLKSLYPLLLALLGYAVCHYLFDDRYGFQWIVLRSVVFLLIYATGVIALKISPDIMPVLQTLMGKLRVSRKK
ncbi:MAG: lipopolysaccharide biosynthesis protein [Chitinophagaceae bacterium]|nr:lipopolysaccharide biosynthesis protein [Chitinophagaceae bacterium]